MSLKESSEPGAKLALGILLFVLICAAFAGLVWLKLDARRAAADPHELKAQATDAFTATTVPADDPQLLAAARETFDAFQSVVAGEVPLAAADLFDFARMLEQIEAQGAIGRLPARARAEMVAGLRTGMGQSLVQNRFVSAWSSYDIKRIVPTGRDEMIVYVRGRNEDFGSTKMRWWLYRRDGRWRLYDFEDLDGGLRATMLMAMMLGPRANLAPWAASVLPIQRAIMHVAELEIDEAEALLRQVEGVEFPDPIEALRCMAWGVVLMGQGVPEKALERIDQMDALAPDMPVAHYLRALAYNQLERYEEALVSARRYAAMLGADAELYEEIGAALEGLNRKEEALEAYAAGLEDDPDSLNNLAGFVRVMTRERVPRLSGFFENSRDRAQLFADVTVLFWSEDEVERIELLCQAYAPHAAGDVELEYYLALARHFRGDNAEAFERFKAILDRAPEDEHDHYVGMLLDTALAAGKPIDGYRAAPDARDAFTYLADELGEPDTVEQLQQLIAAHRERVPADPWLHFFEAELLNLSDDPAGADAAFAVAMQSADEDVRSRARARRVYLRFERGDVAGAYREVGPRDETFEQLCFLCRTHDRVDLLEEVLTLHRSSGADPKTLVRADAHLAYMKKDYPRAIELLEQFAAENPDHDDYLLEDQFIRSLVRSGQTARALQIVRANPDDLDPILAAIAYAAAGDVPLTLRAVEACLGLWWDLEDLYEDEDLGGLLRSRSMKTVYDEYPPPTTAKD